ncbi:MAG: peptidase U32 family protein [Coriobacteriales bacterium]
MELLAPAGGLEQLQYAIRFGADAVYLACDRFGMRQRASNFTLDEIPEALAYAHGHGVKVYVTLNIVMHDDDMDELEAYARTLRDAGVDALIIGDLGAARLVREVTPEVDLHVSTQASVSNALAARTWYELGAKRIVCAREMSLEGIAKMHEQIPSDLQLEAFVHGAMCMAYSGRCLISDYLTGRSALSGHCTQSCRWHYTLEEEKRPGEHFPIEEDEHGSYIMNAEDLNMLAHLKELEAAGIDSIKIEGRNKKAFYVASVVNAYRNVLDGKPVEEFTRELELVSHRPYSTGFYFGPAHQAQASDERTQLVEWAAEVLSCEKGECPGTWTIEARCRNGFDETTPLEALSPHQPIRTIAISQLQHIEEEPPVPVAGANRAMERYRFICDTELAPHTIIRMSK